MVKILLNIKKNYRTDKALSKIPHFPVFGDKIE